MSRLTKLDELVSSVEVLLTLLPANSDPEVRALHDRVDSVIFDAWTSIARDRPKLIEGVQALILMGFVFVTVAATSFFACRAGELRR
jgi:hypothetical protein